MSGSNGKIFFADFEIDTTHRLLRRDGETIALNAKAFDVLAFLAQNAGRVVTKNEILDAVWENQFVEEANLKVQISALRKVLGENADENRYLATIPGKGYKFVAATSNGSGDVVFERHQVSHFVVEEETEIRETTSRNAKLAGVLVAMLLLASGVFWFVRSNRVQTDPVASPAPDAKIKRLTNTGRVNRVKISPDGKFFAYTNLQKGSRRSELRLGQTDGSSDVVLRPMSDAFYHPLSFSADGNSLYCVVTSAIDETKNPQGEFYKIPLLGGTAQKLADDVSIYSVVSPDEKRITFPRKGSLAIADINGGNESRLVEREPAQFIDGDSLSWSTDGSMIAFGAAAGNSPRDSSNKIFEIFVAKVSDGSLTQVTDLGWNRVTLLAWLKDGSGLVATARDAGQMNTSSLWHIGFPSGEIRRISKDVNRYAGSLSLSADSVSLVVVQYEIEANIWEASTNELDDAQQITFGTSGRQDGWQGMDWTPDGQIVSTAWIDESLTIWIMNGDGSNARQLTSIGFRDERPVVTADGKFIVFQSNRSGSSEIWRMDVDGGNLLQLTKDGGNSSASVSSDLVYYRHSDDDRQSLRSVSLMGGEPTQLDEKNVYAPRVSPDGSRIAYGLQSNGDMKLVVRSLTGDAEKIFDVPGTYNFRLASGINWSADGQSISYPDESDGIWNQQLTGGAPTRLPGIPSEPTFSYAWSRDGGRLAYGRVREVRDAVLISNFK